MDNHEKEVHLYAISLNEKYEEVLKITRKCFSLFQETRREEPKLPILFDGIEIASDDLLDLVGTFFFLMPEILFRYGVVMGVMRHNILQFEEFLRKVPCIQMPPRPEWLDEWIREQ